MMRPIAVMLGALVLGGCTAGAASGPARVPIAPPRYPVAGLEGVLGQSAAALTGAFGAADKDVREGTARKLQFASPFCVLDAYLYPRDGKPEPVVTHVDARQLDGRDIDRASCVAAMQRRSGGR